jgi:hypothetical protein
VELWCLQMKPKLAVATLNLIRNCNPQNFIKVLFPCDVSAYSAVYEQVRICKRHCELDWIFLHAVLCTPCTEAGLCLTWGGGLQTCYIYCKLSLKKGSISDAALLFGCNSCLPLFSSFHLPPFPFHTWWQHSSFPVLSGQRPMTRGS